MLYALMTVCMLGFGISVALTRGLTWSEYRDGGERAYWMRMKKVMSGPTGWFLLAFLILAAIEAATR